MSDEKLVLRTSKGREIPTLTLEEALAKGIDFTDRKGTKHSESSSRKIKYAPLTDECNLCSEKGILIKACEQLEDKQYIVLTRKRRGGVYAAIYIPDPKSKE